MYKLLDLQHCSLGKIGASPISWGFSVITPSTGSPPFSGVMSTQRGRFLFTMSSLGAWGESVCQGCRRPWRNDISFQRSRGWLSGSVPVQQSWKPRCKGIHACPCWRISDLGSMCPASFAGRFMKLRVPRRWAS